MPGQEGTAGPVAAHGAPRWLPKMAGARVGVVGDLMLDRFVWGRVTRISPEAPVPVVEVDGSRKPGDRPGGAANVAANLVSLGARVTLFGVTGEDEEGRRLCALCRESGIDPGGVATVADRPTTVKTRVVAQGQQIVRLDVERTASLAAGDAEALYARLLDAADTLDAVVVSDYAKGVIVPGRIETLVAALRQAGKLVAVDPRVSHMSCYAGATVVTPNRAEVLQGVGGFLAGPVDTEAAARVWLSRLGCEAVLVTLGEDGMQLVRPGVPALTIPTRAVEVFDVTGAGDTVIAALTMARVSGASWYDAVVFANTAAGIVVGKVGTAVVRPDELAAAYGRKEHGATGEES